ncbi:unnamed protein product [Wickerhamomyces anomalus]
MSILVTGGAGYIGSHTVIELIQNNYSVIILDNLSNSSYDAIARIEFIVGRSIPFYNIDLRDHDKLSQLFQSNDIKSVIHFAALKAVGESTKIPLTYYDNNINGTINLLKIMNQFNVKSIVFSSSATVYGDATRFENMIPIPESCPNDPTNPYGQTKYTIEQIIHDLYKSDPTWKAAILRYFNPIGAHPSGLIGEDPLGIPNNLLPYLAQVAIGRREKLSIFGNDYDSHDGTPIRDYIHVVDLAKGHISALNYLEQNQSGLFREWNLGTGKGSTVFDVYNAFCKAVGKNLPYEVVGRRDGDVLNLTADPKRANNELKWFAKLSIQDACADLWKWTIENPFGLILKESLVLGFNDFQSYKSNGNPYFGATIGRYANRISNGEFKLNGKVFKTDVNENSNTLHGGANGFDKQHWLGPIAQISGDSTILQFKLIDQEQSNGFPNQVETIVKFIVGYKSLEIEYQANSNGPTPINLTNHSYFKLGNDIDINLSTKKYLETSNGLPTGEILEIPSQNFKLEDRKFDDCFILNESSSIDTRSNQLIEIFKASTPSHSLTIQSTEPSFQFYTGDGVNIQNFHSRSGFAVEPGRFIDAINSPIYSNQVVLNKDETYGSKTKYIFN